jgi:hypothetical protein
VVQVFGFLSTLVKGIWKDLETNWPGKLKSLLHLKTPDFQGGQAISIRSGIKHFLETSGNATVIGSAPFPQLRM